MASRNWWKIGEVSLTFVTCLPSAVGFWGVVERFGPRGDSACMGLSSESESTRDSRDLLCSLLKKPFALRKAFSRAFPAALLGFVLLASPLTRSFSTWNHFSLDRNPERWANMWPKDSQSFSIKTMKPSSVR